MNHHRPTLLLAPLAASVLVFPLAACASDEDAAPDTVTATTETTMADNAVSDMDEMPGGEATVGDIAVTDAWVRQPAEGQTVSAAYGTITNSGDRDITLVGVSVPVGATAEIHETLTGDDGTMRMQEREDGIVIAAGATFTLEPGGAHIMMLDIDPADVVGAIDLTMIFDDGTEVTVTAPVRGVDDMDHDMTESTDD